MNRQRIYPWTSFTQFMEAVEKFENIPPVFNPNKLEVVKGYADQIIASFRFIGFADTHNAPTEVFKRFVRDKNSQPRIMEELLRQSYSEIFSRVKTPEEITDSLLDQVFGECSTSDSTKRKMISFFKQAAYFAGLKISASSRTPRTTVNICTPSQPKIVQAPSTPIQNNQEEVPPIILNLVRDLPPIGTEWSQEKRTQWLQLIEGAIRYYYPEPS